MVASLDGAALGDLALEGENIMHGFNLKNFSDHEFSSYLAKHNALGKYRHVGNACYWYNDDDPKFTVAVAIYNNAECSRRIWIPKHLDT